MQFSITLNTKENSEIPINYQYPLSAAIYRILSKGDEGYASFLHETGYGKGYKFFTFSDLKLKYHREGDRLKLLTPMVEMNVCFHLPEASQKFVEGLFKSETIVIADQKSKAEFQVKSIISLENPLKNFDEREIIQVKVRPASAIVTGPKEDANKYVYKFPDDEEFIPSLTYGWRNKIKDAFDEETAENAILKIELENYKNPFRTRLIHIKDGKTGQTQIKGSLNYKLLLAAERRFVDLILNAGLGVENAQGMGCLEVLEK